MLVSPDLKIRYVAAAIDAVEQKLRDPGCDVEAIALFIAGVARITRELANDAATRKPTCPGVEGSNVISFRRPG